jgi:hypothetical protein
MSRATSRVSFRGRVDAELALRPVAVAQDAADAVELLIASGLASVRRDLGKRALDETRDGHRPTAREVDDGRLQSVARRPHLFSCVRTGWKTGRTWPARSAARRVLKLVNQRAVAFATGHPLALEKTERMRAVSRASVRHLNSATFASTAKE